MRFAHDCAHETCSALIRVKTRVRGSYRFEMESRIRFIDEGFLFETLPAVRAHRTRVRHRLIELDDRNVVVQEEMLVVVRRLAQRDLQFADVALPSLPTLVERILSDDGREV